MILTQFTRLFIPILLVLTTVCSCEPHSSHNKPEGIWRAVLIVPGGELPFILQFENGIARIRNDKELILIEEMRFENDSLVLEMTSFNSTIRALPSDSTLSGLLTMIKNGGIRQIIPFEARKGREYLFSYTSQPPQDMFGGRWAVVFRTDGGDETDAVGEFHQEGSNARGTFLTPTGDYRYLSGDVRDSTMSLATFDGGHAFLFHARLLPDGSLRGDYWSGTAWHESWVAIRDENASLPGAEDQTFLFEGKTFDFSFPDVDGKMVSLSDERYRGKPVLVVLAGSWCPNCHDEAAFLSQLYREEHLQGLEIIGLMYERYPDFEPASKQVRRYRKKFGIEYELLVAGTSVKSEASKTLPMLNRIAAFPTTIFIDRNGKVASIHSGFSGPGTGEHYKRVTKELRDRVDRILMKQ